MGWVVGSVFAMVFTMATLDDVIYREFHALQFRVSELWKRVRMAERR